MKILLAVITYIFLSGALMAIEEPAYTIVSKNDDYEIRQYNSILVAETTVNEDFEKAGNSAFRILAAYIFGENKSKIKIEMTSPVSQESNSNSEKIEMTSPVSQLKNDQGFLVQFTMPQKYTLETLPKPNDERVKIRLIPSRQVAVFSYSGTWSESRYIDKLEQFQKALNKNNAQIVGKPVFARFNSPFQLWFLRRNEIWIDLKN